MAANEATCHFKFQALPQFFKNYSEKAQKDSSFRATTLPGLGLIDRPYNTDGKSKKEIKHKDMDGQPWKRFKAYVENLNKQDPDTSYKVLYITRHGFGYHNAFMSKVSSESWNDHWSHLDGDGKVTWADSRLDQEGLEQATVLGQFWIDAVANDKIPIPETIYSSPLTRCLETTRLVFSKAMKAQGAQFQPIVKELLRERLTNHTCDRRSSQSWIKEQFSEFAVEPGFSEEDVLWSAERSESAEDHLARKQRVLEDIFASDENQFIALTTHSYAISAILGVIGLPGFRVREGSSIAILVKGERVTKDI
ncbi:putative phosphoglycerate mutase [Rhizodiscina lignyota]|uniref:Phosphoglycerate mutase n=1 Tax=Rhizodiscina lignyota TaxID=1504668 RepID=A0A9P4M7A1_9PEZI|nr:putative phosphoglycerate mutase [Rhizodiscina lignyota]